MQSDLTISLGSNGVKLYDMVVAYGAFANGGFRVRPYAVERVENSRGVVIYEAMPTKAIKVISYDTAAGMTYMLKKVVEVGTGRGAAVGREIAGKTGTTDDYRDAWFMGFSPDVVAGVWLGNDDNSKLPGITGGGLPARVWASFMKTVLTDYPQSVFDYPDFSDKKQSDNSDVIYVNEKTPLPEDTISPDEDEAIEDGFDNSEETLQKTDYQNTQTPPKRDYPAPTPIGVFETKKQIQKPAQPFKTTKPASNKGATPLPGID